MFVALCVHAWVCACARVFVCVSVWVCECMRVRACVRFCVSVRAYERACVCVCVYVCVYTNVCVCERDFLIPACVCVHVCVCVSQSNKWQRFSIVLQIKWAHPRLMDGCAHFIWLFPPPACVCVCVCVYAWMCVTVEQVADIFHRAADKVSKSMTFDIFFQVFFFSICCCNILLQRTTTTHSFNLAADKVQTFMFSCSSMLQ